MPAVSAAQPGPASDSARSVFDDVLAANAEYAERFDNADLQARAAKGLAVLTCMDSRIDPLGMLGLQPGDAKILRNAGARVTDDVLRTDVQRIRSWPYLGTVVVGGFILDLATGSLDRVC